MIRNLNQLNFRPFGTISKTQRDLVPETLTRRTVHLTQGDMPVYRSGGDCWLCSGSGMTVLSVSLDNREFVHFYLDKPVSVRAGVYFSLVSYQKQSTAELASQVPPETVGTRSLDTNLAASHRLEISNIYTFFYQEREQGFLFPGESHPMPELTYVDQGELHSVVEGQDLLLKQGDLVIYGSNQWHMQYADIGVAPRFVTISFDVGGVELTPLLNRKFTAPQATANLLQSMLREQEHMDSFSTDIIVSQLTLLLLYLLREAQSPSGSKVKNANIVQNENEIIRLAQQYVAGHIREKLSVPMVANQVGVSPSYLTVLFHKNLQISPGEYIRRIKLQESKQMIRENNLNFTQIAAILQYSTVHHFSRQFKDKFGITPTEYAKSVR